MQQVDKELAEGRPWRAKEILQGQLRHKHGVDAGLIQKYGEVLLSMGDLVEAGRYLFFSGVRKPEYEQAIGLFVTRNEKCRNLARLAPKAMQRVENLEQIVGADRFVADGFVMEFKKNAKRHAEKLYDVSFLEKIKINIPIFIILAIFISGVLNIMNISWDLLFENKKKENNCPPVIQLPPAEVCRPPSR